MSRPALQYVAIVAAMIATAMGLAAILVGGEDTPDQTSPEPGSSIARAAGVAMELEPGWRIATESLTPDLLSPKERLSIGTFAMEPGGRCAHMPSRAYSAMGPSDAMITLMERGSDRVGYPPRPRYFDLDPKPVRSSACRAR